MARWIITKILEHYIENTLMYSSNYADFKLTYAISRDSMLKNVGGIEMGIVNAKDSLRNPRKTRTVDVNPNSPNIATSIDR